MTDSLDASILASPFVIVVAGPNGAGKSTAALGLLRGSVDLKNYINPDLIARGLAPLDPDSASFAAGRIVLGRIRELASRRENFAFETTLSGRTYVSLLAYLRRRGYSTRMIFLSTPSPSLNIARVAERVSDGGHDIRTEAIVHRHAAGLRNFFRLYRPLLNSWFFFNSTPASGPVLIASGEGEVVTTVVDSHVWNCLEETCEWPRQR